MDNNVPFIAFEGEMNRMERIIKRLCTALIVTIVLLVATNVAWLYHESQFTDEVTTIEAEATDGGNAVINGSGEVRINGEGQSN